MIFLFLECIPILSVDSITVDLLEDKRISSCVALNNILPEFKTICWLSYDFGEIGVLSITPENGTVSPSFWFGVEVATSMGISWYEVK